jgi:AAA15 family ATPase/GTPase
MFLDSINIENYRGIGKMELDQFSPITVLVGRNNTSKSAFLEAVTLLMTGDNSWRARARAERGIFVITKKGVI